MLIPNLSGIGYFYSENQTSLLSYFYLLSVESSTVEIDILISALYRSTYQSRTEPDLDETQNDAIASLIQLDWLQYIVLGQFEERESLATKGTAQEDQNTQNRRELLSIDKGYKVLTKELLITYLQEGDKVQELLVDKFRRLKEFYRDYRYQTLEEIVFFEDQYEQLTAKVKELQKENKALKLSFYALSF